MTKVVWAKDGLMFFLPGAEAARAIQQLRDQGFKRGMGSADNGLYSPNWDRQMAERGDCKINGVWEEGWWFNPSMLNYLTGFEE